ncbi:MAG TPA: hypothetical protein VIM49_13930 [Dermatophilaceae bacterium]
MLFVVSGVLLWWNRNEHNDTAPRPARWVALVLAGTAVLAATGTTVQAVRIGHSGATAVWSQAEATTRAPGATK